MKPIRLRGVASIALSVVRERMVIYESAASVKPKS